MDETRTIAKHSKTTNAWKYHLTPYQCWSVHKTRKDHAIAEMSNIKLIKKTTGMASIWHMTLHVGVQGGRTYDRCCRALVLQSHVKNELDL